MSKFNQVLEKQIERKANQSYDQFWKEFEALLNKYGLDRNVMFYGLANTYKEKDDKGDQYRKRVFEIFVGRETERFLSELSRIENYFNNGGQY